MNSLVLVANVLRQFNQEICNQRNNKHLLFTVILSTEYKQLSVGTTVDTAII